jgi:hypothetical protein
VHGAGRTLAHTVRGQSVLAQSVLARTVVWPACALLLAGCASMPDRSEVTKVGSEQRSDADQQVRVFGVKPQKNEQPLELVRGFLEATTSDEADYQTAREYLTPSRAARWNPFVRVSVLSGAMRLSAQHGTGRQGEEDTTVSLAADQVATVDRNRSFAPAAASYRAVLHLVRTAAGDWRIDSLPDGLALSDSDFQRIYQSVNRFYFAQPAPDAGRSAPAQDGLVADPVYVRRRIDPVSATVQALLSGPSSWLQPVVTSAFPAGTRLGGQNPVLDDSGNLRVRFSDEVTRAGRGQCERMAAQLLQSVQDQSSARIESAQVQRSDGTAVCTLGRDGAQAYAPGRVVGDTSQEYFVDAQHRVVALSSTAENAHRVPGPLGDGRAQVRSVAVARDGRTAAGVRTDGRALYVAALSSGGAARTVLTSAAHDPGNGLTAASWDGLGNLWVADRDPARPRLLMWRDGRTTEVSVPNLADGRIEGLRVAADGVRVALLVHQAGHTTLRLGRVERGGTADRPEVSVTELRTVAPQLADVEAASWAGESRLVVVGRQSRGVQQLQYVDTDGSAAYTPSSPGISRVSAVAASEDQSQPLLVDSEEGMYRLPADAEWRQVSPDGMSPVYPG